MPFQGNEFVRTQNFVRDRDLGPPENVIAAEKIDDEMDGIAAGLTEARTAAATAQAVAVAAGTAATTEGAAAVATLRGGIDAARDTLQKLADWTKGTLFGGVVAGSFLRGNAGATAWESRTPAQVKGDIGLGNADNTSDANKPVSTAQLAALNAKLDKNAGTMTGNRLSISGPSPGLQLYEDDFSSNPSYIYANGGSIIIANTGGNTTFSVSAGGAVNTAQLGDLYSWIEARATAWANNRIGSLSYRLVSQGEVVTYYTGGGGYAVPGGSVMTGLHLHDQGGDGGYRVRGFYYKYPQIFDPVRGWVGFNDA